MEREATLPEPTPTGWRVDRDVTRYEPASSSLSPKPDFNFSSGGPTSRGNMWLGVEWTASTAIRGTPSNVAEWHQQQKLDTIVTLEPFVAIHPLSTKRKSLLRPVLLGSVEVQGSRKSIWILEIMNSHAHTRQYTALYSVSYKGVVRLHIFQGRDRKATSLVRITRTTYASHHNPSR